MAANPSFIQTGNADDLFQHLEDLAQKAVQCSKTARRNRVSLLTVNFYATKLAGLRTDATVALQQIRSSAKDCDSQLRDAVAAIFEANTDHTQRVRSQAELTHLRRTGVWSIVGQSVPTFEDGIFPLELLIATKRGHLITVGKQINGCFHSGWFDACSVMMRRLLETAILELFEAHYLSAAIKKDGNFVMLSDLISATLAESTWNLSRNSKAALPKLKELGDLSAHSRTFTARTNDIELVRRPFRVAVEEILRHANLLLDT